MYGHMPRQNYHTQGMWHALLHVLLLLAAEQAAIYSTEVYRDVVRTFLHGSWLRKIFKQPRMAVITAHVGQGNSVILATPLTMLQEEWEGKKKSVWSTHQRNGTHILLSPPFSTEGGMGPTASVVYKRIVSILAQKYDQAYSKTLHWIRCKLGYSLLRSAIMCL